MIDPITVWRVQCGDLDLHCDQREDAAHALMDALESEQEPATVELVQMERAEFEALEEVEN